jgi:hypothetical protein
VSIEAATVWGPIIAALVAALISVLVTRHSEKVSERTAREVAQAEIVQKLHELRQTQISEIVRQRIVKYPSLWQLCQECISMQRQKLDKLEPGWEAKLSDELEKWHAENGVFLSQPTYDRLFSLRQSAWELTEGRSRRGETALQALDTLDALWSGNNGLAARMKDDLGSYQQAALSVQGQ